MSNPELRRLRTLVAADAAEDGLSVSARRRIAWSELVDRVGRRRASELWWATFGATDASET